jgi:hypothetical protein
MRRGYPNVAIYPSHSRDSKPLQFSLPIQIVTPIDAKQCWEQLRTATRGRPRGSEIGSCKENLLASLANKEKVTRAGFMAVCGKKAS